MIAFISILGIAYMLMCLLLYLFQRQIIYFPTSEVNIPGIKHTTVDTGEAKIKVWILHPGKKKSLLYFGGNAENVAYNIDTFSRLFKDHTLYLINYRGYGGSSDTPHENGFYKDALFLYDYFSNQHSLVSVMGRSIGAAVAIYLASERTLEKLILVTPFDSAVKVGKKHYWLFPMDLILKERFDSLERAAKISTDTLVIIAEDDRIIPYENTHNLVKSFSKARVETVTFPKTGHNTVHRHPDYRNTIRGFIAGND